MWYLAKCHVRLPGYTAHPGEVFEAALEEDSVQRLQRLGAIEPVTIPAFPDQLNVHEEKGEFDGEEPDQEETDSDEGESQEDENPPAPEIDVMDGISSPDGDDPGEKPSKRTSRSGGKTK